MCGVNTLHCSLRGCAKPSHNCPRLLIETSNSTFTLHLYYQNVCNNLHFKHCVDGTNSILWHMILYSHADDRSKVNVSPVWLAPQRRSGCISCRGEPGRSILADGTWGFWFTLWQRSGEPRRGRLEGSTALIDWWSKGGLWSVLRVIKPLLTGTPINQSESQLSCVRQSSSGWTVTVLKEFPYHWNTVDKIKIYRRAEWCSKN